MNKLLTFILVFLLSLVASAQTLQTYIDEAVSNNPGLQAYELRFEIAREKVKESTSLPNTELGLGYFVSEPETRTGAQVARISGRQMLPWFGTIAAREDLANSISQTEYIDWVIAQRRIAMNVAQSYYKLYGIRAKQTVLRENIELLETYQELALNAIEVSKASAVDVLKLQIRKNELIHDQKVLHEVYRAEQAHFNTILNRGIDSDISSPEQLGLPDKDPILSDSLAINPELIRFDVLYESVVKEEFLNQKQKSPRVGLGLDYLPVEARPDMIFDDNGKDILMPMISLSVPLFNTQFKSRSKQNELRQQEIRFKKQERLNVLEALFLRARSDRNEARISFETQEENLGRARDAEQILVKNYETGTIDFSDILDVQELQLQFQLKQIEAVRSYYEQSALINYLTQEAL